VTASQTLTMEPSACQELSILAKSKVMQLFAMHHGSMTSRQVVVSHK